MEEKSGNTRGYNTSRYYRYNQDLRDNNGNYMQFPEGENDMLNTQYDQLNSGKYENYNGNGYYGSNYGSINELNRGRDFEQNAGYRDSYNRLTTGQWPEIEEAARRRGLDPQQIQRMQAGFHRGKGPRSYKRSDVKILDDVHDILMEDPYVDASDIEIDVKEGEVTLTGSVDDRNTKRRVEDLVESISGVKHLENRLRVRKPAQIVNISNSQR
jgi:osmotically-inducible protein OsmY